MNNVLSFLNTNSNAITAVTAIIIAGLAIYGIKEWKRQIKGKTNYEIARRYLKASFKLRDALKYVRNPFIPVEESEAALKEHKLESEDKVDHRKINMAVYSVRWKKVQATWTDLEVEMLEAEISWGIEAANVAKPLIDLTKKLFSALKIYLDGHGERVKGELIYNQGSEEDPDDFTKQVSEATDKIRDFLKSYL